MRIGEIVGGVALVGLAVLVGIALTDDGAPETITADTTPFVFDTSEPTSTSTSSSTLPPDTSTPRTTEPVRTTVAPTATTPPTSTEPVAPTTTLLPPEQRSGIAMRVLNGGAPRLAATNMSATLRTIGFAPAGPADARRLVSATRLIYVPGHEVEVATVNEFVGARPENVVPASADDPNWAEFGGGLTVLVVLGPAGT